ncbi:methyltransferase domain-containing protein [Pseudofrankia sp. BMG5.37]|uniref:class I SAM-dependent DNA methyltransferase n=1 Tax=Pseudofrankia sp. BMG5.37 TaxID=3050035 RepID=UPI002894FDDB|nr:methyltransferase domain-containing protein [Pseudofrankia sp. BMG5.37]MDT3440975.1 methyltransferase domain-containing protein [Pseudofrankia sp. BMG5.37]
MDPGVSLLGDVRGRRVVELGCGTGDNLAYLVGCGADGVGIDPAAGQIRRARARWPKPAFHCVDAARYLSGCVGFDVCYSCFGAFSFYPAESLLDLVGAKLTPGGLLAVSATVGDGTGPRREIVALGGGITVPVIRYEHTGREWRCLLSAAGFGAIDVTIVDEPRGPDTVIATARRLAP